MAAARCAPLCSFSALCCFFSPRWPSPALLCHSARLPARQPHAWGFPARLSLRSLAQRLLGRGIQEGAHDPREDAAAALDLASLKFRSGPTAGAVQRPGHAHLLAALVAGGRRVALVGPWEVRQQHGHAGLAAVAAAAGDEEAAAEAAWLLRGGGEQAGLDLLVCQLSDLLHSQEDRALALAQRPALGGDSEAEAGRAVADAAAADAALVAALRQRLAALHAALPRGGVLLAASAQGDTPLVRVLQGLVLHTAHDGEERRKRRCVPPPHSAAARSTRPCLPRLPRLQASRMRPRRGRRRPGPAGWWPGWSRAPSRGWSAWRSSSEGWA